MSQQKKLEQILTLLVNEESEKAEELLHDLVVEKARNIYEEIVNDEEEDDEEMDESIGGDPKQDFISEIEADRDDVSSDELNDGEAPEFEPEETDDEGEDGEEDDFGGDDFGADEFDGAEEGGEEPVENQVLDLQSQIAELRAEFEQLLAAEMDEPGQEGDFTDMGGEMDFGGDEMAGDEMGMGDEYEEGMRFEAIEEATKLQDNVPDPGMNKEGKLAGTGKNSKTGATNTQSPYTKAPSKSVNGESAVDFTKGSAGGEYTGPSGGDTTSARDDTPSDNIGEEPTNVSHGEQKSEGDFVGTGKNSKKGAVNTKSPLSTAPKKP